VLPGWRERSLFIERIGLVSFYHYDPYAQALSKVQRGHEKDLADVQQLIARGHPAVDPASFRRRLDEVLAPVE
jgi:hypothetical protein